MMKIFKKVIYPVNLKRVILALIFVAAITFITVGAVYDAALRNVTLVKIDEFAGEETSEKISTRKTTFREFLEDNKIIIGENDVVNVDIDDEISDDDVLIIRKGRVIELTADGNVQFLNVTKATVGDALLEAGVELSDQDRVTPDKDARVTDRIAVKIDRFTTDYRVVRETIEFDTERVMDNSLEEGKTKVTQTGKNGEKEVKYSLLYKNGDEISKDIVSETVITEPITHIVHIGTKAPEKTVSKKAAKSSSSSSSSSAASSEKSKAASASGGKNFSYSKKIEVSATAYAKSLSENGGNSKTAYGLTPKRGIVAVDPKVIPLGTRLYIESPDGGKSWSYGYCIAGDTGGAIKGNKVDLCFDTEGECIRFGRRSATVYVLN